MLLLLGGEKGKNKKHDCNEQFSLKGNIASMSVLALAQEHISIDLNTVVGIRLKASYFMDPGYYATRMKSPSLIALS